MKIIAIAACDSKGGIGKAGQLPWHVPQDLAHFRELTEGHSVLMGHNTYLSLPERFRPLPKRRNIVVSRSLLNPPHADVLLVGDLVSFLQGVSAGMWQEQIGDEELWVIGGGQIYADSLPFWDEVHLTRIDGDFQCDTFFPRFELDFSLKSEREFAGGVFEHYVRALSSAG